MGHLKENKITAILLAGGKSSRFKKDKAKFKINSKSLSYLQYKKLNNIFKNVYISTKKNKFCFKANIIIDKNKEYLPIFVLINLIKRFHKIFILPVDEVFIDTKDIYKLLKLNAISKNSPLIGVYTKKDIKKLLLNIKNKNFSPRISKKKIIIKNNINLNFRKDLSKNKWKIKNYFREI